MPEEIFRIGAPALVGVVVLVLAARALTTGWSRGGAGEGEAAPQLRKAPQAERNPLAEERDGWGGGDGGG